MKKTHLTPDDRTRIETLLSEGRSIRYIADRLDKAPSTVSREISKHKHVVLPRNCDCIYLSDCSHKHVCGSSSCRGRCSNCSKARKFCGDYVKAYCDYHPDAHSQICNACHKKISCIQFCFFTLFLTAKVCFFVSFHACFNAFYFFQYQNSITHAAAKQPTDNQKQPTYNRKQPNPEKKQP